MSSRRFACRALAGIGLVAVALAAMMSVSWAAETNLTGAGATFPYPLYSKWFDVYQKATGVRINYQSIGSGGGIQQLKNGTVDFGASDAPLSDEEMKDMPGPVVHIPTAAGAVAVVYNLPGIARGLRLSGEVIANIFLGGVTRWNDRAIAALNPGVELPDVAIAVAHRSDGSGTTYIFTHYLAAVSKPWAERAGAGKSVNWPVGLGGKGNEGVAGIVKQTPGAIGYVELAYATQNHLAYAAVRNRAGAFVKPSLASTTAAVAGSVAAIQRDVRTSIVNAAGKSSYPIAGLTYILVYRQQRDREKGRVVAQFLRWAVTDGQEYTAPLLYAPLPPAVVAVNNGAISTIGS